MGMDHMRYCGCGNDHGPEPFVANIIRAAEQNRNFRTAFWTGNHLQMTLMCIPVRGEVGMEIHPDTDQYLRVEEGQAVVCMGDNRDRPEFWCRAGKGDGIFVPSGTWHNIVNAGRRPLKLSSVYAPPQHARGTVHRTKAVADYEERSNGQYGMN